MIRTDADGTGETAILEDNGGPLAIDHDGGKLYWSDLANTIRRANLNGTQREDIVNTGSGHIYTIALDRESGKLYWHNSNYHNLCRSNLDGTRQETIVAGIIGATDRIAIDAARKQIYWAATNHKERGRSVGLWRVKCPAPPHVMTRPAPPYVIEIMPHEAAAGDKIQLVGGYFNDAVDVMLLDDGDGSSKPCKFTIEANGALTFTVPRCSTSSHRPLIVVRTPGGVTVTLPRSAVITGRGGRSAFDRFHPDDKFAQLVLTGGTVGVERAAVVAMRGAVVHSGPHGENIYFLRDGAIGDVKQYPGKTVFFEPSASIIGIDKPAPRNRLVPVPAIRPSFVDPAFQYSNNNKE